LRLLRSDVSSDPRSDCGFYPMRASLVAISDAQAYKSMTGPSDAGVATRLGMAVASDDVVSTHFDVPANQESGPSKLEVVANGIASEPLMVLVKSDERD
jgi:hypothetical protein